MFAMKRTGVRTDFAKAWPVVLGGGVVLGFCSLVIYASSSDRIASLIRSKRPAAIKELRIRSGESERVVSESDAIQYVGSRIASGAIKPIYESEAEIGNGTRVTITIRYADGWEESKGGTISEAGMSLFLPSISDVRITLEGVYFPDPDIAEISFREDVPQSLLECVDWADKAIAAR